MSVIVELTLPPPANTASAQNVYLFPSHHFCDFMATVVNFETEDSTGGRQRRLGFTVAWNVRLLKAVTMSGAHIVPYEQSQTRFCEALALFEGSVSLTAFDEVQAATWMKSSDRFKKLVGDHRRATKANKAASGIIKMRGERETLLDDVVQTIDEFGETFHTERHQCPEIYLRLQKAGKYMRNDAVSRGGSSSVRDRRSDEEHGEDLSGIGRKAKMPRPTENLISKTKVGDEEDLQLFKEQIAQKHMVEERKVSRAEKQLKLQKE